MRNIANLRIALYIIAALLAAGGIGNAFVAGFFQTRHEVVYNFDVTVVYCAKAYCAYSARLTIANTGHQNQDTVTLTMAGLPADLGGSPKILNLSSAQPRSADPEIKQHRNGEHYIIQIAGFSPGTLVEFTFMGSFPEEQLPAKDMPTVTVTGKGRIIEGDPRAITFMRFFS